MNLQEIQQLIDNYINLQKSHFYIGDYIEYYFEKVDPDEYKGIFNKYGYNIDDDVDDGHNLVSLFCAKETDRILNKIKDQLSSKDYHLLVKQELEKARKDEQDYYLTRLFFVINLAYHIGFKNFTVHISPIVDWLVSEYVSGSGKLDDYRVLVIFEQIINTVKHNDKSSETSDMMAKIYKIEPRGDEWVGVMDHIWKKISIS